ncbi:hypothetical protein [Paenibacillus wynnii]|uniref:Uncharacterized protein n=1 Tax=Paenibacillus wynnii TaxID=268407 RepID=A0A098M502_9BACL|nr:hypothetical protein [Paenibacillus wynnii]KGE17113.1 hypothetical protein PWYN_20940 [Paenibacillus wynnii]
MKIWQWGYESDNYDSFTFPNPNDFNQYFDPNFNGAVIGANGGACNLKPTDLVKPVTAPELVVTTQFLAIVPFKYLLLI